MKYSSKIIDHLGIVAGVCKEIGLVEEIDGLVGVNSQQKVTTGEAVMAMVINALGFVSKPLYLFPDFMQKKSMSVFFREDISPENFNDDIIGRALDKLYENNPTTIFMHIAFKVSRIFGLKSKFFRLDTTTMSVHGEYKFEDMDMVPITITHGHSKDGREDLKQFVVSLITSSQADIPVWVAALNGNSSDKKHFAQVVKEYSTKLAENKEDAYYVMDSAMYTEPNVIELSPLVKWISRVPESIQEAKDLITATEIEDMKESTLEGYRYKECKSFYGGVEQKWVVVFSKQAYERENKTLVKNIKKENKKIALGLWHFGNREFKCEEDGIRALNDMIKKWKYHRLKEQNVVVVNKSKTKGRPKKGSTDVVKVYRIKATFEQDTVKIGQAMKRKGKFIVATNSLGLDGKDALKEYKGLQGVERGFRFLKDPMFFASSVFLKSPRRIVSLVMIMALSLLIYAIAQHQLRSALEKYNESVPDQKGKPTKKPTMRWIFQQFEGIHLLERREGEKIITEVLNLRDVHKKILEILGPTYEKIYLLK